jgi:methionine aminopeptidase
MSAKYTHYVIQVHPIIKSLLTGCGVYETILAELIRYLDYVNSNNLVNPHAISLSVNRIIGHYIPDNLAFPFNKTVIHSVQAQDGGLLVLLDLSHNSSISHESLISESTIHRVN